MRSFALFVCFFAFSGCVTGQPADMGAPIKDFHKVDEGLYRGANPDAAGMRYLSSIGIKTIVKLNDDQPESSDEFALAKQLGIDVIYVPLSGFWAPRESDMDAIQGWVSAKAARPLFVHCHAGHDRTGLTIGLYRVHVDGWDKGRAYEEMKTLGFHSGLLGLDQYFWAH